jgi:hypothetical protein
METTEICSNVILMDVETRVFVMVIINIVVLYLMLYFFCIYLFMVYLTMLSASQIV